MKNKIKYNKTDKISNKEFNSKNTKIRITTYIDLDIIEELKREASQTGKKYQALLNEKLRQTLANNDSIHSMLVDMDERLKSIEKQVKAG